MNELESAEPKTGHPCRKKEEYPICPICGEICNPERCSRRWDIVGCAERFTDQDEWEKLL